MVIQNRVFRKPEVQNFMIREVEKPLRALLRLAYDTLPKPERDKTRFHNTKILIDCYHLFQKYFLDGGNNKEHYKEMCALWKWGIIKYDKDPIAYASIADWLVEQIFRRGWARRPAQHPSPDYWKESQPYGGYYPVTNDTDEGYHKECRPYNDVRDVGKLKPI